MPILSNKLDPLFERNFIFRENAILLKDDSAPTFDNLSRCLALDAASDWFSESEQKYNALLLGKDEPNPKGLEDIPIREFFARTKGEKGVLSELGALSARARGLLHFREQKRFCQKCGLPLKDDETLCARKCQKCGSYFFPQIEPAVIVCVKRGEEILLARHANRTKSFWTTLAGFVEIGETAENAVKREVFEETAIRVKNIRYVASQSWPFPDQLMLAFVAEYDSGEINIQKEEILEAAWFSRTDLPEIAPKGSVAYDLITGVFD